MLIQTEPHPHGVILPVKAQPGSSFNGIRGAQDGALKVHVTQVAEKGKANKAIRDTLCKQLKLRKSNVELLSGETSRMKKFLVRGIPIEDLNRTLIVFE